MEQGKAALTSFSIQSTRNRCNVFIEMEFLITWLEEYTKKPPNFLHALKNNCKIYNINKTGRYWKKTPFRTFLAKN
jgi:hypothetical protein